MKSVPALRSPGHRSAGRRPRARATGLAFVLLASAGAAACSGSSPSSSGNATPTGNRAGGPPGAGRAAILLAQVPVDVSCVEIDVAGARDVTDRFDVTVNETATLSLTGLPLGDVTFTGQAYPLACAAVTGPVQATWISAPTAATLTAETVANVSLALVPNGQASVSVGFNPDDAGVDGAADADGGPPGVDGGPDASEGGTPDAALPVSFTNPVQIGGIPFNANTVVTTLLPGVFTTIDGFNEFPTQGVAQALSPSGLGLPDNGFFPASGTTSPNVQLAWGDPSNPSSSLVVSSSASQTFSIGIPPGNYQQLQIYATNSNGQSTLSYTLTYSTDTSAPSAITVPDWCLPGPVVPPVHVFASADRVVNTASIDTSVQCDIYAIDLNPDATKTLTGFALTDTGGAVGSTFVLYGATAW